MSVEWNNHYKKEKSVLSYPDENLVRLLKKKKEILQNPNNLTVVDLGCGSGRHVKLIKDLGVDNVIGMDYSLNGLKITSENFSSHVIQNDNKKIPLKSNSVDIIVAWGSLHYNKKQDLPIMIKEIYRVLKKDGIFYGTIRSSNDSYLKKGKHLGNDCWQTDLKDIKGSITSFYDEEELNKQFEIFNNLNYGLIERTILGDLTKKISHWVIEAGKNSNVV